MSNFFTKRGLFLKNVKVFLFIFNLIYTIFLNSKPTQILDNKKYFYLLEFMHNIYADKNSFNLKFLLNWVFSWNYAIFDLSMIKTPKKYKKKSKKKYSYSVIYIKKNKQFQRTLR
jgi:hypothetical protein